MTTQLSAHFTLEELTHSDTAAAHGIANTPTPEHLANAKNWTAPGMELLRHLLGDTAINVHVAYRNPEVNVLVGGTATSAHPEFFAVDFDRPGETPRTTATRIAGFMKQGLIHIDQLILERAPGRVVHVSFDPRGAKPGQTSKARGMMGYQPGGPGTPIDWGYFK